MRVGQPRWRLPATCSTACWTWDARTTSASPEHVGAGVSAAAPLIPAPRWPPYSPKLQPAEHLWPVLDEPLANQYFATLADLEHVVSERCRVLNHDQLKPGTNFHWWPKPDIPA